MLEDVDQEAPEAPSDIEDDGNDAALETVKAPVKIDEMISVLRAMAHREEGSQEALVAGGFRDKPHAPALRRVHVLDRTADFLDRLKEHDKEIKRILTRKKY